MVNFIMPKISFWEKAFIFWIIIYPITTIYEMPNIPSLTVGDIGMFIILIMLIITKGIKKILYAPALFMLVFVTPWLFMNAWIGSDAVMRMLRYMFSLFVVAIFVPGFCYKGVVFPMLKKIAVVSSVFVILQFFLATFFGFYLSGIIPFLESTASPEALFDNQGNIILFGRFRGFFNEPAAISIFLAIALLCSLSENKRELKQYIPEFLISIGIIIVKSTTGLGLLIIIWGYWIMFSKNKKWGLIFIALPIIIFVENQFNFLDIAFQRGINITDGRLKLGQGTIWRLENVASSFDTSELSMMQILFGQGMIRTTGYIPGWVKCFVYFGASGIFFFTLMYIFLLFRSKGYARVLIVCLILSNIFADYIFGIGPILSLPFFIVLIKNGDSFAFINRTK